MDCMDEPPNFFKLLPKAELHQHLDGSVSAEFLLQQAQRDGFTLPFDSVEDCLTWVRTKREGSLENYLELFQTTLKALQTVEGLTEAVRSCAQNWVADGVRYAELRFAPHLHLEKGLTIEEVVEAVILALLWVKEKLHIPSTLILCALRHQHRWGHLPLLWRRFRSLGLPLAIDLAGPEKGYPPEPFEELFKLAQQEGIPITIHAGEVVGPSSIASALQCGAQRIGHGVRLIEEHQDGQMLLTQQIIQRKIALELCPSSNFQTRAWDRPETYPLKHYLARGVPVTINTDNTLISLTSLSQEWEIIWGREPSEKDFEGIIKTLLHSYVFAFNPTVSNRDWIEQHILPDLVNLCGQHTKEFAQTYLASLYT
jgi:adenosine deaminase